MPSNARLGKAGYCEAIFGSEFLRVSVAEYR